MFVKTTTILAFVLFMIIGMTLFGCKSVETKQMEADLKAQALDKPMIHLKGTKVTILIEGSDQVPAEYDVYNPSIASDVVNSQEPSIWQNIGVFLGGVGAGWASGGMMGEVTEAEAANACSNTVPVTNIVVYLDSVK